MPTIRVAFTEPWSGAGYEGAWLIEEGVLSVAQEETLQAVLAAVDPDLEVATASAAPLVGGASTPVLDHVAIAGDRLRGFIGTSDRMVRFRVAVTGRDPLDFRCEVAQPAMPILLPGSIKLNTGDHVVVTCYNESDQGTANAAAAILWRNNA